MRPKPRPRVKPLPRRKRKRRLGTVLFFIGLLTILGTTFAVGALAGRFSIRPTASAPSAKSPERAAKAAPAPQPELTFYRELTAPLTAPQALPPPRKPLPAKPASKSETATPAPNRAPETVKPVEHAEAHPAPAAAPSPTATSRAEGTRYTVQVGSYNARAQADAARARLASAGHDAYVAEGDAGGVTRYRVRIGAFASAEEARQAAVRLASEARVATYVTTR